MPPASYLRNGSQMKKRRYRRNPPKTTKPVNTQIELAKPKRSYMSGELGVGGVQYTGGLVNTDEFNENLTGLDAVNTYDKMRRSDAQVAAVVNACRLPLLSATWDVDRPPNDSQADKITDEHLEFARDNLFRRIDFNEFLMHATSCLWAGYAIAEIVYAIDGGKYVISKLAPRLATTIESWFTDDNGNLTAVEQYAYKGSTYAKILLPRDKIVLFTYGKEANNYQGLSLMRPIYKHHKIKDMVYKLDAIRCERYAVGVPKIMMPEDCTDDLYDAAKEIGKNWKGAQQSYVVLPFGMDIQIVELKGGESLDLMTTIKHHNEEIAKVGLVQFINLGHTEFGSRALAQTITDFFYDAQLSWAEQICTAINTDVLWPLLDMNFPDQVRPTVVCTDMGAIGLNELITTMKMAGAYLPPTLDLENAIRDRLGLSRRTVKEWEDGKAASGLKPVSTGERSADGETKTQKPKRTTKTKPKKGELHRHVTLTKGEYWRPLRESERHVNLTSIDDKIDTSKGKMLTILMDARDTWLKSLSSGVSAAMKTGPVSLTELTIPDAMTADTVQKVLPVLRDIYEYGSEQVKQELRAQTAMFRTMSEDEDDNDEELVALLLLLLARSNMVVKRFARKTTEAFETIALDMYRTVGPESFSTRDLELITSRTMDSTEHDIKVASVYAVTETLNLGRNAAATLLKDQIGICEYSAILDTNTCRTCVTVDGTQVKFGSTEYFDLMPPLKSNRFGTCKGYDNCRCIWIYLKA